METDEKHSEQRKQRMSRTNTMNVSPQMPHDITALGHPKMQLDGDKKVRVDKRTAYWVLVIAKYLRIFYAVPLYSCVDISTILCH